MYELEGELKFDYGYEGIEDIYIGRTSLRDLYEKFQGKNIKVTIEIKEASDH